MYYRQKKRLLVVCALFLVVCSSYLVFREEDDTDIILQIQEPDLNFDPKDPFAMDHIDIPEIPVGDKAQNDSDYEILYKQGIAPKKKLSKLSWHNDVKRMDNIDKDYRSEKLFSSDEINIMAEASGKELDRYRDFFASWPTDKPKAAFYVLTGSSRVKNLKTMLESVDKNFNEQFQYPIIIFHEASFTTLIPTVRTYTKSALFFQLVQFRVPEFLHEPVKFDIPCFSHISYRHMCRFNAKSVYEEPTIRALDYYWRLDDDSVLTGPPIDYDVFTFMAEKGIHYGYSWIFYDADSCVTGLWEATGRFVQMHNIQPKYFQQWAKPKIFYNNFEISSTKIWLSEDYTYYIDYLDQLGGIYYTRWGDAPIHGIAVSLFLEKNQTHFFYDIGYQHGSYIHKAGDREQKVPLV